MMGAPFALSVISDGRPAPGDRNYQRRFEELLEEARVADRLGFRGFWTCEQHYAADDGHLGAQFAALAGLATSTSRLRLMTNTLLLPLYQWRQVVEQAVVVDLLSGGRLEIGVAGGGNERDFDMFGVDFHRRGELMERGIPFIRQGLVAGELADGPGGTLLPMTPRPVQERVPILVGGLSPPAVDRAVRLGDGHLAYDYERFEENLPKFWDSQLRPAMDRHGRSLADFRFTATAPFWVSEDPERDWEILYKPAYAFHMGQYLKRYRFRTAQDGQQYVPPGVATDFRREDVLVDTPENIAHRLLATWRKAPWHEFSFFCRLPGIPHERTLEHLEFVAHRLVPLLTAG